MEYFATLDFWDRVVINFKASLRTCNLQWEEWTSPLSPAILRSEHKKVVDNLPKDLVETLVTFGDHFHPLARLENFAARYETSDGNKEFAQLYFLHLEGYKRAYEKIKSGLRKA